jgi:SAM-dependent methyltransferase
MAKISDEIRSFWDIDAATYDNAAGHHPRTATELAAWSAALRRLLPPPPAKVLDAGAGTGFLSLLLAEQGYVVTAIDVAPRMLEQLRQKAAERELTVETLEQDAATPPSGPFDAVVERHLVWTLPDPAAALAAWRRAAPSGRLVLFESEWGETSGLAAQLRSRGHALLRQLRHQPGDHHAEYDPALRASLPLGRGTTPEALLNLVGASAWGPARIERLRDVEWASRRALPTLLDQLIGPAPRFAVVAG